MTSTIARADFYRHPDPIMSNQQERARITAENAVRAGAVAWNRNIGVEGGFATGKQGASVPLGQAIALHELLRAGRITVNKQTGRVSIATAS
ncbi:hypothetical protein BBK82_03655 [Lentzea guizhouensis]|uniref:Uncharacterized protein n=1 Tax=Lentzea guizhouensis TaxID=1586287 RepID=A0A1B2HC76_9PSEU|nr:hypothetical protein [Lentzea guizhouensis]ANZ35312.1 hypothetical protein BBK82_03655 [Lentzea guizhouensis]